MLKKILNARVYDILKETPLDFASSLSAQLNNEVFLKREDLQEVFSFKIRGAYNAMAHLNSEEKGRGVIAASAGNHAQGVALSAKYLGLKATIVMPVTTPKIKVDAVKSFGGEVVLHGDHYSAAAEYCNELQKKTGQVFIHPFDNEDVIAGQGTIAMEILHQVRGGVDALFVPVGGGGLLAGVLAYCKEVNPNVQVFGVEPEDSNAMGISIAHGERVVLPTVGLFADGVAVKQVGVLNFDLCRDLVDGIITVSTDEICSAIKLVHRDTRSLVEPSGALSVAGLKKWCHDEKVEKKRLVAICSGANMNFERLSFVAERTRLGEKQEALFAVHLPEKPGALRTLCTRVLDGFNITEFNYRKGGEDHAEIFLGIGIQSDLDKLNLQKSLKSNEYECLDLSENNLAKTHVRYMIGSRSSKIPNERLLHFWFPERPGALRDFLNALENSWNISLFHYRSRGGDFAQVLVGLEIQNLSNSEIERELKKLPYEWMDETENPVCKFFISGR